MNLRTIVKVGSITNLSDARFCAGFGVDLLGFNLNPNSNDYISIDQANEIMGWVAGPGIVAEVGNMSTDEVIKIQSDGKFPFLEVENIKSAKTLINKGFKVILKLLIESKDDINLLAEVLTDNLNIAYLTIACRTPELVPEIENQLTAADQIKLIKAYDVELSQLDHIIQVQPFHGIELMGSREEKPGFKEYDDLADILEALEIED